MLLRRTIGRFSGVARSRTRGGTIDSHAIRLLGTGLIGDFYTNALHGQRGLDRVPVVYSRGAARSDSHGRPIEATESRYPADRHALVVHFEVEAPDPAVVEAGA